MGWLEDFLENRIDVQCLSEDAYQKLLIICQRKGIKNADGEDLVADDNYRKMICITCISNIQNYTYLARYELTKNIDRNIRPIRIEDFKELEE